MRKAYGFAFIIIAVLLSGSALCGEERPDEPYWETILIDDFEGDFGWPNWKIESSEPSAYEWSRVKFDAASGDYCLWGVGKKKDGTLLDPETDYASDVTRTWFYSLNSYDLSDCEDAKVILDIFQMDSTDCELYDCYLNVIDYHDNRVGFKFGAEKTWQYGEWREAEYDINFPSYFIEQLDLKNIYLGLYYYQDYNITAKGFLIDNFRLSKYRPGVADHVCEKLEANTQFTSPGDIIQMSAVIKNNGNYKNITQGKIKFILSSDMNYHPEEDAILGYAYLDEISSDSSVSYSRFLPVPDDLSYGAYHIGVVIDDEEEILESDKSNNTFFKPDFIITVRQQKPEWHVLIYDDFESDFGWPLWNSEIVQGNYGWGRTDYMPHSGSYCLWSAGKTKNGPLLDPSIDRYIQPFMTIMYTIHVVDVVDYTDLFLVFDYKGRTDDHFEIEKSSQENGTFSNLLWRPPPSETWKQYQVNLKDKLKNQTKVGFQISTYSYGTIEEGVFLDNFQLIKYHPFPDLLCSGLQVQAQQISPGDTLSIYSQLTNQGHENAQNVFIYFYLSGDQTLSVAEDYFIGSTRLDDWAKGSDLTQQLLCAVPPGIPEGEYYLCADVDHWDTVEELTDDSNIFFSDAPRVNVSERFSPWITVFMEDFETGVDWETWQRYASFGSFMWGDNEFRSLTGNHSLWCAGRTASGSGYDPEDHACPDNFEGWMVLNETVDLTDCEDVALEFYTWSDMGQYDYLDVGVRREGEGWTFQRLNSQAAEWKKRSYSLSNFKGQSYVGSTNIRIAFKYRSEPDTQNDGLFIDYLRILKKLPVFPDLTIDQIDIVSDSAAAGQSIEISVAVQNSGQDPSGATEIHCYLSRDTLLQFADDIDLGFFDLESVPAGASFLLSTTLQCPEAVQYDAYSIIGIVDEADQIEERNENNNVRCSTNQIRIVPPNREVTIETRPCEAGFSADEQSFSGLHTFFWQTGSQHMIQADSLSQVSEDVRYLFESWSDGGARTHPVEVTEATDTLAAVYRPVYKLTLLSPWGGLTGDGWYEADSTVSFSSDSVYIHENIRYRFNGWEGEFQGGSLTGEVTMNGPKTVTVLWQKQYLLDFSAENGNGGFVESTLPNGWVDAKHCVTLTAVPDSTGGYVFTGWSGDIESKNNPISVVMDTAKTIVAGFALASSVEEAEIPAAFGLKQNYPNPFNPVTQIRYALPEACAVRLIIYDIRGHSVFELQKEQSAGNYQITWQGRDRAGANLPSGVYFYQLEAGEYRCTRKMLLVR